MSDNQSETADILMHLELSFQGISHVRSGSEDHPEQCIYLLSETSSGKGPKPSIDALVADPTQFREVLLGFLSCLKKGMLYKPKSYCKSGFVTTSP